MKTNAFSTWILWAITMIAGLIAFRWLHPALGVYWVVVGSAVLIGSSFLPLTLYAGRGRMFAPSGGQAAVDSGFFVEELLDGEQAKVDPWDLHRPLMRMSGQRLPDQPMITSEVIRCYAGILEEASEAGITLLDIMRNSSLRADQLQDFALMRQTLATAVRSMGLASRRACQILGTPAFSDWAGRPLTLKQAVALLDDHLDLQVMNTGFGLSAGLPCQSGYLAVGESNVSKADPATGRILRDKSGRWIKGPDYKQPDLRKVILDRFPNLRSEWDSGFAPTQPSHLV